jgi:hypothetical protein
MSVMNTNVPGTPDLGTHAAGTSIMCDSRVTFAANGTGVRCQDAHDRF